MQQTDNERKENLPGIADTQLMHSKQNAFVGIYFSNPHLTDLRQLDQLDTILSQHKTLLTHSPSLMNKLGQFSYKSGYQERIFRRFHHEGEFQRITKAWKHDR